MLYVISEFIPGLARERRGKIRGSKQTVMARAKKMKKII